MVERVAQPHRRAARRHLGALAPAHAARRAELLKALPDAICQLADQHTLVRGTACAQLRSSAYSICILLSSSTEYALFTAFEMTCSLYYQST